MSIFRAMGSQCRIVAPERGLAVVGERMIRELERRWSRFDPSSEISALNESGGGLAIVSPETFELVSCSERARDATCGAFNPLTFGSGDWFGGHNSWDLVWDAGRLVPTPFPVCREPIELIPEIHGVRLPEGTCFDPGAIGKGLAADLVAAKLRELGASTAEVEFGGDIRVFGPEWSGGTWAVRVGHDLRANDAASISLIEGGVSTSGSDRRSWRRGDPRFRDLIDPSSDRPRNDALAAAAVVASTLWWAEAVAKATVSSGRREGRQLLEQLGMNGVLVSRDATPRYDVIVASVAVG